jgi:hypothetical protein
MTKEEFINKHNPSKTIKKSLSASISASVQHNKLYKSPLISNNIKKQVRDFWSSKLILIKEKYVENNWGSKVTVFDRCCKFLLLDRICNLR